MSSNIPTAADVRAALQALGHAQLLKLSAASGVSLTTLWNIRSGDRPNPGIETVRKFMPFVAAPEATEPAKA